MVNGIIMYFTSLQKIIIYNLYFRQHQNNAIITLACMRKNLNYICIFYLVTTSYVLYLYLYCLLFIALMIIQLQA